MQKEVTIYDIARELNLSPATVSRGLKKNGSVSKATTKRVVDKAELMGYRQNRYASSLRTQSSNTIGVVLHKLNSSFVNSVVAGIEKVITKAGYDMLITHSAESFEKEKANVQNLFHQRVDGLIASLSFTTQNLDHFQLFQDKNIPVIFFDRVDEKSDYTHVVIDNYRAGYLATKHLADQGCSRIMIITSNLDRNVYQQRFRGYKDALFDSGISVPDNYTLLTDLSETSAMDAAIKIIQHKSRPDALFFTNDFEAVVCMRELIRNGIRVPEDIAIVGFNNDMISTMVEPQLSTINYPAVEMGEIAATNLINHLAGTSNIRLTSRITLNSDLIIRQSSLKKK